MFNPYAVSTDYASCIVPFGAYNHSEFDKLLEQRKLLSMIKTTVAELNKNALYERSENHDINLVNKVLGMIFEASNSRFSIEEMNEKTDDFYKESIVGALEVLETFLNEEDAKAAEAVKEAENGKESFAQEMFRKLREAADKKEKEAAAAAEAKKRRDDPFLDPEYVDTEASRKQAYEAHQAEEAQRKKKRNAAVVIAQNELRKAKQDTPSGSGASTEPESPFQYPTQVTKKSDETETEMLQIKLRKMSMSYDKAFATLSIFTMLFYNQCKGHFDGDYQQLEASTKPLSELSHDKEEGHKDLSKKAHAIIEKRWEAAITEWEKKSPKNKPRLFFHGIAKTKGMPSIQEAGLAYLISAHFPGAWNEGSKETMTFGRHLFEMKRFFIERLIQAKVESVLETIKDTEDDSQFENEGLRKMWINKKYLEDEREKLNKAGNVTETGKSYVKHHTRVELQTKVVNGQIKQKPTSSRRRLTAIYAVLHQPEKSDRRFVKTIKKGTKEFEVWWGEKAQTDWLFLA
tara:strand:- start:12676 stop:14226 length:1551 start_codon:yes stop_codon:yes gene_type:complete